MVTEQLKLCYSYGNFLSSRPSIWPIMGYLWAPNQIEPLGTLVGKYANHWTAIVQFGLDDHETPKSKLNGPRFHFPYIHIRRALTLVLFLRITHHNVDGQQGGTLTAMNTRPNPPYKQHRRTESIDLKIHELTIGVLLSMGTLPTTESIVPLNPRKCESSC